MKATAAFLLVLCHLALSHALNCKQITLRNVNQIDAGLGQVVATDRHRRAFFLSGNSWYSLPAANLKHISAGPAGIWGTNHRDYIYKFGFGRWIQVPGLLKQVDAGGAGFPVGTNKRNHPFCLKTSTAINYKGGRVSWTGMSGSVKYYSCGPYGCWAVNSANQVFLMKTVNQNCGRSGWQYISGVRMTMIEVATDGSVHGVTTSGQIYSRVGISAGRPQGVSWKQIQMCTRMKSVSYDLGRFWLVTTTHVGMVCT